MSVIFQFASGLRRYAEVRGARYVVPFSFGSWLVSELI